MGNLIADAFPANPIISIATSNRILKGKRVYVIFFLPRSGSTWLTELASKDGRLGTPHEWFNEWWIYGDGELLGCVPPRVMGTHDINEYIERVVEMYRSPNGVMGLEISLTQMRMLIKIVENPHSIKGVLTVFYLRRRNLVAQAISIYRSVATSYFHSFQDDSEARSRFDALDYSGDAIAGCMQDIINYENSFEELFATCGIKPHRFFYEDIVADNSHVLDWMAATVTGSTTPGAGTPSEDWLIKPISDWKNRAWEEQFRLEQWEQFRDATADRPALLDDPSLL